VRSFHSSTHITSCTRDNYTKTQVKKCNALGQGKRGCPANPKTNRKHRAREMCPHFAHVCVH